MEPRLPPTMEEKGGGRLRRERKKEKKITPFITFYESAVGSGESLLPLF
jgi:hypothetical protein